MKMAVNFPYSKRVSFHQMETLIEYMDVHRDLAVGICKTTEARAMAKRLWAEIAHILNGIEGGARKSGVNWSKHWSDYKIKLKYKIKSEKNVDSNSAESTKSRLTNLDKRALMFLGAKFGYDGSIDPLTVPVKRELINNKKARKARRDSDNIVLETRHQPFTPDNQTADALMILAEAAKEQADAMRAMASSIAEGVHAIKMLLTNYPNNSAGV